MKINKNKIPFYIMLILGAYWIIILSLVMVNQESGILSNVGVILSAMASFYISVGILVVYLLRAIILFLTTGKWWK
jgi:hypothetical protein